MPLLKVFFPFPALLFFLDVILRRGAMPSSLEIFSIQGSPF